MDKTTKPTTNGGHIPPKRQRLNERSTKPQDERQESHSRCTKSTVVYTANKNDPFTSPNVHNRHVVSEEKRRTLQELVRKQKQERAAALKLAEEKERERQRKIAENLAATAEAARLAASRTIHAKKPKPPSTVVSTLKNVSIDKERHQTSSSDAILSECARRASQLLAEADGDVSKKIPKSLPPKATFLASKSPKTNRDSRTTYVAPPSTIRLGVDSSHRVNNLQRSYPPQSTSKPLFCNPEPAVLSQSLPTKSRTRRYAEITQTHHYPNPRSHLMTHQLGVSDKKTTWRDAASEEARLKARLCASRARRFVNLEGDGDDGDGVNCGIADDSLSSSSNSSSISSSISDLNLVSNDAEDIASDTDEVSVEVEATPPRKFDGDHDDDAHTTLEEGLRLLHERNARFADPHRFMEVYKSKNAQNQDADSSSNLDVTLKAPSGEEDSPVDADKTSNAASTIPSLEAEKQSTRLAPAALGMSLTAELRRFETLSASEQHVAGLEMTRQLSQAQAERMSLYELHKKSERLQKDLSDKAVSPMIFSRSQLPVTFTETITQRSFTAPSTALLHPDRRVNGLDVVEGDKIPSNLERTFKVEDLPIVKSQEGNALLQRRYNELDSMRREAENMYRFAGILDREDDRVSALYIQAFQRLSSEPKSKKVAMAIASALDQPQPSNAIKPKEEVQVVSSSSSCSSKPPPPPPPPQTNSPIQAEPIASSSQRANEPSLIDLSVSRVSTVYEDTQRSKTSESSTESSSTIPQSQHHNSGSPTNAPLRVNSQLVTSFDGDAEALAQLQREIRYYEKLKAFILKHKAEYNRDGIKRSKTFLSVHMKYIKDLMQKLEEEKSHLESEIERSSVSQRSRAPVEEPDSVSDSTVSERRFPSRSLEALSQRLRVEESLMSSLVDRIKQGLEKEISERTASRPSPAQAVVEEEDITTASSISSNISEVEPPPESLPAEEEEHSTIEAIPEPPEESLDARSIAKALQEEAESNDERSGVLEALQTSSSESGSSETAGVYTADFEDEEEVEDESGGVSPPPEDQEDTEEIVESRPTETRHSELEEILEAKLDEGIPVMLLDILEDILEEVVEGVCGIPPDVQLLREACPEMPHDIARGKVANMPHRLVPLFHTGLDFFLRLREACQPGKFEQALRETSYPPEFVATYEDPADVEIARRNEEVKWINRMLFFDLMREEMQCVYAGEDDDIRLNRQPRITSDRIRLWRGTKRPEGKQFWESHMRPQLENILGASLDPVKAAQVPPQTEDLELPEPQLYDKTVARTQLTQWTLQCKRNIEDVLVELDMRADDASWRVTQAHMQAAIRNATEQVFDKIFDSVVPQVVAEVRKENPGIVIASAKR